MDISISNVSSTDDKIIPLTIENIAIDGRQFNLIQETYLSAGTKQRGLSFFQKIKEEGYTEIVTYGTVYGYGQVATAWCCKKVGLLCTIYLPQTFPRTKMTFDTIKLGANVIDVSPEDEYPSTKVLSIASNKYASLNPKRKMVELGLDDPGFINALSDGIKAAAQEINPKRIWVAGGSCVLSRALSKAFPNVELMIVQVGRKIHPDVLKDVKHTMFISPEAFRRAAIIQPPYKSLKNYDAKIWRFIEEYGKDGDYIWNVK